MSTSFDLKPEWSDPREDSEEAQIHDYNTVSKAAAGLTPAQNRRLEREAGRYTWYLHRSGWQASDLVQEALCRTLSGVRSWSVEVSFMTHLRRTMGSMAADLGRHRPLQALLACELGRGPSGVADESNATQVPFEERAVAVESTQESRAAEALQKIRAELLKRNAHGAWQLLNLRFLGYEPWEIRRILKWSCSTYRSHWQSLRHYAGVSLKLTSLLQLVKPIPKKRISKKSKVA